MSFRIQLFDAELASKLMKNFICHHPLSRSDGKSFALHTNNRTMFLEPITFSQYSKMLIALFLEQFLTSHTTIAHHRMR